MKLPVDDDTLAQWSTLLGLTETQQASTLQEIEKTLRLGHAHRPDRLRDHSFEDLLAAMSVDELALMFLSTGLRQTGHPDAARAVEMRALAAQLKARHTTD
ncbi:hypothetical protein ACFYZ5_35220 [Streptomyces chartreusis]|uniref:hypothetical protein n=1 Tax=Streptomyces chartreusis TaxID=1969 RepID=UPI0036B75AAE